MSKRLPPRLQPDTNGNFYVHFTRDGRSQRQSLRTKNLFEAEARFNGWLEAYQKEQLVEVDPVIEQCLDLWMDQWIVGRMLSEKRYPAVVNNLNAFFGKMRVSEVERHHARTYRELRQSGRIGSNCAANATVRHELKKLRACLRFMAERVEPRERRISFDIIPYIDVPENSAPRNRVLSAEEADRIYHFCKDLTWNANGRAYSNRLHRVGRFCVIAMETAQRKSAICELTWDQVDLDRGTINFLPTGRLQTIKRRPAVPISTRLRPVLERSREEAENEYVLDSPADVHSGIKQLAAELRIDGLSAHVFRHTWATRAVERGVPLSKVAAFLGDTEKTVRENYMHLSPDYLRDVVE